MRRSMQWRNENQKNPSELTHTLGHLWWMNYGTFEIYAASTVENSCEFANDGVCDVPHLCAVDTDAADCSEFYMITFLRTAFMDQLT